MQAITTRYIGPSATKGSRIKATCDAGSLTVDFHSVECTDDADRYVKVARMLADKLGWTGAFVSGGVNTGDYVHVFTDAPTIAAELADALRAFTASHAARVSPTVDDYNTARATLAKYKTAINTGAIRHA